MDFSWQNAGHGNVRELGWSLFSPPIAHFTLGDDLRPWQPILDEEALFLLKALDKDPSTLGSYLNSLNDLRLGARFEALWNFFLKNHSFYEVLAANRQINDGSG